jgi:death-on-curing protein
LVAAYGYALARGHCFTDCNKRVALAVIDVFLRMNGSELTASEPDAVVTLQALAAGI